MARRAFIALLGALVLAGAIWRSAPSADEGQVLVLAGRGAAGPVRLWTAPWAPRARWPARVSLDVDAELRPGDGSAWPVAVRATLELDPERLADASRALLLGGDAALREQVSSWVRRGLADVADRPDFDPQAILFRPDAASAALSAALTPLLPPGLRLAEVDARVEVSDVAARARALAEAHRLGVEPSARVLYVGLDGADWAIADPMIRRGELPVLARLIRTGVRADLTSFEPMMSPLLWTTAITGRGPDVHGIFDFTLSDADGNQVPISSRFRRAPAVWEMLGAWDDPSAFVNFWATHPTEETRGVLVSDIADTLLRELADGASMPPGVVWPTDVLDGVPGLWRHGDVPLSALRGYVPSATAAELADARSYWSDPDAQASFAEGKTSDERKVPPLAFLVQVIANSHNLERIAAALLERSDLGVVGVYFGEIDQVGHNFQHLAPPPHPLADSAEGRFSGVVAGSYRAQDATLGRLIEAAGPQTVVIVHSDHGFRRGDDRPRDVLPFTRGQPVEWHRLQGVFVAAGGPVRRGARVDDVTLYDVAPTLLALRGVPAAETMPGRVRDDLLDPAAAARLPRARIADWDALVAPRRYAEAGSGESLGTMRQDLVEQLRALGYIGGGAPGEDQGEGGGEIAAVGDERPRVTYYRNEATWLMNEGRFAEAEQALLQANRLKPLPKTYSLLSEAAAAQGEMERAARALAEGFERFPDTMPASAVLWEVELQLERGDLAAARRSWQRGRSLRGSESAPVVAAEGRIAEAGGDADAARRAYIRALELDPREVRAAERFAALAGSTAGRAALEPYLQRALAQDPRIEIYWQMLGLIRVDRGDHAGAADAFGRAADLEPNHEIHRLNEAMAALRAGQRDRAARLLQTLAERGSRESAVWVNLGRLRADAGDWAGARDAWERAVELGAGVPGLPEALADARRRAGAGR